MSLAEVVRVNTLYTRSINLERDGGSTNQAYPYVPTSRALQTLRRMTDAMHEDVAPRAWALVGPYGSGKSAFGLFVAQLLAASGSPASRHAHEVLRIADAELSGRIDDRLSGRTGYCVVLVSGAPEPFAKRLLTAMATAAEEYWRGKRGRLPQIVKALRVCVDAPGVPSTSQILDLLSRLQAAVAKSNGAGLLLVIDELGKFLEFEARHRKGGDTFLLQALAERACGAGPIPIQLLVLMHQGFEFYAKGASAQLRDEWRKVQGRFESVPYLETTEQALRVVQKAITQTLSQRQRDRVLEDVRNTVRLLEEAGALPSGLDAGAALPLFADCFPLHPVSLLLLPSLCQRMAQSERTLFSYLGSSEPYGFLDRLGIRSLSDGRPLPWILPWEIYDYFILTQPGLLIDHATHRRWAEVSTAVERLGDAPPSEQALLKTIGLLNIVGAQGGLKASPRLLQCLSDSKESEWREVLRSLDSKSLVTYRRFGGEYRVWQGSDFDLDAAASQEREQLESLSTEELLNQRRPLKPIVARRHSIESGTVRHFSARFCGKPSAEDLNPNQATILYCLARHPDEFEEICRALSESRSPQLVAAAIPDAEGVRDAVLATMALERVATSRQELANDPIAKREIEDRLAIARSIENEALAAILEQPEDAVWFAAGKPAVVSDKRGLQETLSLVLDVVYSQAPIIRNELINRDRPSATAVAARNKLLAAMFERAEEEDLGIEKFPAEKAMYRAVLRASGLHQRHNQAWRFGDPKTSRDSFARVGPVWRAIGEFVEGANDAPRPMSELLDAITAPPYGVRWGVVPVLIGAFILAHSDELALFENGHYVPFVGVEAIERAMKAPATFSIQRFALNERAQAILRKYVELLDIEIPEPLAVVAVAKPLARLMAGLPDYTKRTRAAISKEALAIRELFMSARSPGELLLKDIPAALGLAGFLGDASSANELEEFGSRLRAALVDLRVAYHALLHDLEAMLKRAFAIEGPIDLFELRTRLRGRASGLEQYTIDTQGLKAFINRVTDGYGDEKQWLVSVGSFLGRKPPEKWSDEDRVAVDHRLTEFAARLRDLERLRIVYEDNSSPKSADLDVVLIRTVRRGDGEREVLVSLDPGKLAAIHEPLAEISAVMAELPRDLRSALLASLLHTEFETSATWSELTARADGAENG